MGDTSNVDGGSLARLSAEDLRHAVLMSSLGFAVATAEGRFLSVNPAFCRMLGRDESELLRLTWQQVTHPDDLAEDVDITSHLIDGTRDEARLSKRFLRADGASISAEILVSAIREVDGQLRCLTAQVVDVSDLVAATEQLELSERRYRLVAENATDVVFLVGVDELIVWVSPSVTETLGWPPEGLLGTRISGLLHPDDGTDVDAVKETLHDNRSASLRPVRLGARRYRTASGGYLWMSARATILRDDDGQRTGAVVGLRDVDELVHEREVARSEAAMRRAIIDTALEPWVLLDPVRDEAGRIVDFVYADANESACLANGIAHDELIGARLLTLFPLHRDVGLLDRFEHLIETGEPIRVDEFTYADEAHAGYLRVYDLRGVRVRGMLAYSWHDVTERVREQERIRESEERYRLLAENSSDVVLHTRDNVVEWVSPALTRSLGWRPDEWVGHSMAQFGHPDDAGIIEDARLHMEGGGRVVIRIRIQDRLGSLHWVELHSQQYVDHEGNPDGFQSSFRTVDREVEAEERLERRARFDELTGVLKREEALSRMVDRDDHRRVPGDRRAVLFIDLDSFKDVNDRWGHVIGDAVLRAVAIRIQDVVRSGDTVARMGGDEFLVVLDAVHDLTEAEAVAEKIRAKAEVPIPTREGPVVATVSIGVTLGATGEDVDSMLVRADDAMYSAKRLGRNRVFAMPAG